MYGLISWLLVVLALVPAALVFVLFVEVLAAVLLDPRPPIVGTGGGKRQRLAVVIPAHDESIGILPTLADLKAQLGPGDRLLVVADNCTDDTAAVARVAGAEVVERADESRRGKGYALDFGLRALDTNPPDVVVFVDADSRLEPGTIGLLASCCSATGRPVQAQYLFTSPANSAVNHQVAEFAVRVKNWLRQRGLASLGMPCQLLGTGMAFPWSVIRTVELASGQIVEDLKLGLDLARAGKPPIYCESAIVTSEFPATTVGTDTQRRRWEHGHVDMIIAQAPSLIRAAFTRRDVRLCAMALDLAVPPLVLLGLLVVGTLVGTAMATLLGASATAFAISVVSFVLFSLTLVMAWFRCGRDVLPRDAFVSLVPYVLGKLRLHRRRPGAASEWIRTDRNK
jgi:cellulose synthase/poly-beta-1,6-N-acetylglucosamine synthase-like glycosyltransferase